MSDGLRPLLIPTNVDITILAPFFGARKRGSIPVLVVRDSAK
jgi:hypothetical protein